MKIHRANADINGLAPEVSAFEPRAALDGGADGLEFVSSIIKDAPLFLKKDGTLLMEFGFGQAKEIVKIVEESGAYKKIVILKDLRGIERVLKARRKP